MTATPNGTYDSVTYQWYYNTTNTAGSGTQGGTSASYNFNTDTQGTYYISCKATYTYGETTETKTSGVATITVEQANYSVTTGDITTNYGTLAQANAGASNGSTIKLLRDVEEDPSGTISKEITLDLQSNTMTTTGKEININEKGKVTITGTGKITNPGSNGTYVINNSGKLIINGATISNEDGGTINNENGELTLNIGEIRDEEMVSYSIYGGNITINGGKIYGSIFNDKKCAINDGMLTLDYISNKGELIIGNKEKEVNKTTPNIEFVFWMVSRHI